LRGLNLSGTAVTDDSLKHLAGLTKLEYLSLGGTPITDAGLEHLRGLVHLKELQCSKHVTDAGATKLKEVLPRTHILYIKDEDKKKD
jgi:hypothetical protein